MAAKPFEVRVWGSPGPGLGGAQLKGRSDWKLIELGSARKSLMPLDDKYIHADPVAPVVP